MEFKEPKNNPTIEETIDEIKKAEAEKEVESTVEEFETEAVAEVIEDEMPVDENKDELEAIAKTEKLVKEMELNFEAREREEAREKLIEYSEKITEITKEFKNTFDLIKQEGAEGRNFDDEFNVFLEKRKKEKDYCPSFTHPNLEKVSLELFEQIESNLSQLKEKILKENLNRDITDILDDSINNEISRINFLRNVKTGDYKEAFKFAKETWGDIDENLVGKAKEIYDSNINLIEASNETIDLLKSNKFNAEDIGNYFSYVLEVLELDKENWRVVYEGKDIDVSYNHPKYNFHVITIPQNREVDGLKLLKLISHEIGIHVLTDANNAKNGFRSLHFGKDYTLYQEGMAMLNELKIEEELIGKEKENKIVAHPYYIIAMNEIKEGKSFGEVFDSIVNLKKEELMKVTAGDTSENEMEKEAIDFTKKICRRIYRGFNPAENSNLYFSKDKSYFEGEIGVSEMEKEGLSDYLIKAKLDLKNIAKFEKLGLLYNDKELHLTKDIVNKIWKDKGWPVHYLKNRNWYGKNTQDDRAWAYLRESGNKFFENNEN